MATTVVMPQMGFDMQEGTIVRWLKQEGEEVSRGEAIAEIETDKAIVEMEAFASGVLLKTVVGEGETVPVGQTIAVIGAPGEPLPDLGAVARGPGRRPRFSPAKRRSVAEAAPGSRSARRINRPSEGFTPWRAGWQRSGESTWRSVKGSGPGGRITRDDVLAADSQSGGGCSRSACPASGSGPSRCRWLRTLRSCSSPVCDRPSPAGLSRACRRRPTSTSPQTSI